MNLRANLRRLFSVQKLPWFFAVAGVLGPVLFFIISGYTLDTDWHPWFITTTYIPYAMASTVIFGINVAFIRRDMRNGRLPTAWLVALTYATGYFVLLFWGATMLVLVNNFYLHADGSFFTRRVGFALIGSGLAGDGVAAIFGFIGFRRGLLGKRIHPWIWSRRR